MCEIVLQLARRRLGKPSHHVAMHDRRMGSPKQEKEQAGPAKVGREKRKKKAPKNEKGDTKGRRRGIRKEGG